LILQIFMIVQALLTGSEKTLMKQSAVLFLVSLALAPWAYSQKAVTLEELLRAPFPENVVAAKKVNRVAWTFNQEGKRNIWVAEGPSFAARRLTSYVEDDGQAISELSFSEDGSTIVYVRNEGKNVSGQYPNPTSNPAGAEQTVWTIAWSGGEPKKVDVGNSPQISSRGLVAYLRDGQIWTAPLDGSGKPVQLVVRGQNHSQVWSPDGSLMAFVSSRGDHGFIAVYELSSKSIRYIAPTVDNDSDPRWSLDGKHLAFVRRPAQPRDSPTGFFIEPDKPRSWAIWVADVAIGNAREIWHSSASAQGSYPYMAEDTGGGVIQWAADNRLLMASEEDGWQHLYELPADGSLPPQLLTPGACEVEQWSLSPDRFMVLYNSNCGDVDHRHVWTADIVGAHPTQRTKGQGIEWSPVMLSDKLTFVYLGSDASHPGRPFFASISPDGASGTIASESWPKDFPSAQLVTPQQVVFHSGDGLEIHGQLFLPANSKTNERKPGLVFMHGGPVRQMLLGWHYMYYYANAYAMNQYLASRGYAVLSVNYRSGIGYGRAFREAAGRAGRGASEYQDIVAAGKYLQSRSDVDPVRVGLWGGSYGGYLTALGLGRNSDIFAAGVDFHGVHDWPTDNWDGKNIPAELTKLAHESSPVTAVDSWKSPVLFIHGDDDRNVYFTQTVDLVARLRARGVSIEQLIFPDEIHDFLLYRDWVSAYHATADFFDRRLKQRRPTSTAKAQ
jgi:dipeptidyl aminopeptidase/acylaminoacyl peptidase